MPEKITYTTFDGVKIVGDWYPAPITSGVVVLMHTMPTTRKIMAPFAQVLAKHNVGSLAIDFRGHGESTQTDDGDILDYQKFNDSQHQQYLIDAIGAVDWLKSKNYSEGQIMMVGASIGANIAIWMLEQNPALAGAVMLSPGIYRGIDAVESATHAKFHQALWAAGSDSDDTEAYETAKELIEQADVNRKKFVPYKNAGHGIHLFTSDPKLMEDLAAWIQETFQMPTA